MTDTHYLSLWHGRIAVQAATPASGSYVEPGRDRCPETGEITAKGATFASTQARKAFNNRRLVRGAELYDLFMALRFDRAKASRLGLWRALCRLASKFRDEDVAERGGRRSWQTPEAVLARHAYLHATCINNGIRAGRGTR